MGEAAMPKQPPPILVPSSLLLVGLLVGTGAGALEPSEVARAIDPSVVRIYVESPSVKGSGTWRSWCSTGRVPWFT